MAKVYKGTPEQFMSQLEDRIAELEGGYVESSTDIKATSYKDTGNSGIGIAGEVYTEEELKQLFEQSKDSDYVMEEYDSFEDWLFDTVQNGYLIEVDDTDEEEWDPELYNNW